VNTKEYIESGILEAYVIDALTPEERLEVEANIARYPELAKEVNSIEEGMLAFAKAGAKEPPSFMKERIWQAIELDSTKKQKETIRSKESRTIPLTKVRHQNFYWQRAAIFLVLAGSLVANYILWSENSRTKNQQLALTRSMDSMRLESYRLSRVEENARKENEMLADTAMQAVVMKTMVQGHPMAATVYWSKSNGEIYLAIQKLPPPPHGKQYQMWVIQNGSPVSMGVIPNEVITDGIITKLPMQITNGQAFAISLEKEGGNPTPTEVQVLGKPS
jgi:anti-sigma-K factor RskA